MLTRNEAIRDGKTRYFTAIPCRRGHVAERLVSSKQCVECANLLGSAWKKAHREICTAASRKWREANADFVRELKRNYYRSSKREREMQAKRSRRWLEANREKSRAATAAWRERNLAHAAANQARRRASLLKRTPSWANQEAIRQFYVLARELTAQTGVEHEVDHIYPLQGELVSGLHVETNLRVIPKGENRSKGYRIHP